MFFLHDNLLLLHIFISGSPLATPKVYDKSSNDTSKFDVSSYHVSYMDKDNIPTLSKSTFHDKSHFESNNFVASKASQRKQFGNELQHPPSIYPQTNKTPVKGTDTIKISGKHNIEMYNHNHVNNKIVDLQPKNISEHIFDENLVLQDGPFLIESVPEVFTDPIYNFDEMIFTPPTEEEHNRIQKFDPRT